MQRFPEIVEKVAGLYRILNVSCEKTYAARRDVGDQSSCGVVNLGPPNTDKEKLADLLFKWKFVKFLWRLFNSVTSINTGDVGNSTLKVVL